MRFSPRATAFRSIGLFEAELGACARFSPDVLGNVNSGVLERELERAQARTSTVVRAAQPKRKAERASEPALAKGGIPLGR